MRNALLGILALILILIMSTAWSLIPTGQITTERFEGIHPLRKPVTNIVIVHGIGEHCIGYADALVLDLLEKIADSKAESIKQSYLRYVTHVSETEEREKVIPIKDGAQEGYQVNWIPPPRNGHCRTETQDLDGLQVRFNPADDSDSVMSSQDAVCEFINQSAQKSQERITANCHKLYVHRVDTKYPGENPEYATGFVRYVQAELTASRRLRIYEVTWSPATRWIKDSLKSIEQFNQKESAHFLNDFVKRRIMNSGMADAVAYLTNGGVLVNFNILQSFCLVFANGVGTVDEYPFACNNSHLQGSNRKFADENDIIFISHSLGTRVLFDTIGLLTAGMEQERSPSDKASADLVSVISSRLEKIGAVVPQEFADGSLSNLLKKQIPAFAQSLRSIYVFTNQVPLLAADITSPFKRRPDVARGFAQFVEMRNNVSDRPLQVVAFHDPDDVLSYNLSCWYRVMILKHRASTRDILLTEAKYRAEKTGRFWGQELRDLQHNMFNRTCSREDLEDPRDRQLWTDIVKADGNAVRLVDATTRLKGLRIAGLAAHPLSVHSNYFYDEKVHDWLVSGN